MSQERVQKILAQAGIASRRKAEELIKEGSVTINGQVAKLGDKAAWGTDAIKVNGKLLRHAEPPIYLAFFKPKGVICAMSDPQDRPTLKEFFTKLDHRLFPVGRLDFNSEGLLLMTNDGDFLSRFQKRDSLPKTYVVKIKGHIDEQMVGRLRKGALVEDAKGRKRHLKPAEVWIEKKLEKKTQIKVMVTDSGAFDVKALFDSKRLLVEKITRTSIGHITLRDLEPGTYRVLQHSQVEALLNQPELGIRDLQPEMERAELRAAREALSVNREAERTPSHESAPRAGSERVSARERGRGSARDQSRSIHGGERRTAVIRPRGAARAKVGTSTKRDFRPKR